VTKIVKEQTQMKIFEDTLYFYSRWKDLGSHFASHPKKRKVFSFLMRHIVFLNYESNQGEHCGLRN
jgi:hypothetical protein